VAEACAACLSRVVAAVREARSVRAGACDERCEEEERLRSAERRAALSELELRDEPPEERSVPPEVRSTRFAEEPEERDVLPRAPLLEEPARPLPPFFCEDRFDPESLFGEPEEPDLRL